MHAALCRAEELGPFGSIDPFHRIVEMHSGKGLALDRQPFVACNLRPFVQR